MDLHDELIDVVETYDVDRNALVECSVVQVIISRGRKNVSMVIDVRLLSQRLPYCSVVAGRAAYCSQ